MGIKPPFCCCSANDEDEDGILEETKSEFTGSVNGPADGHEEYARTGGRSSDNIGIVKKLTRPFKNRGKQSENIPSVNNSTPSTSTNNLPAASSGIVAKIKKPFKNLGKKSKKVGQTSDVAHASTTKLPAAPAENRDLQPPSQKSTKSKDFNSANRDSELLVTSSNPLQQGDGSTDGFTSSSGYESASDEEDGNDSDFPDSGYDTQEAAREINLESERSYHIREYLNAEKEATEIELQLSGFACSAIPEIEALDFRGPLENTEKNRHIRMYLRAFKKILRIHQQILGCEVISIEEIKAEHFRHFQQPEDIVIYEKKCTEIWKKYLQRQKKERLIDGYDYANIIEELTEFHLNVLGFIQLKILILPRHDPKPTKGNFGEDEKKKLFRGSDEIIETSFEAFWFCQTNYSINKREYVETPTD